MIDLPQNCMPLRGGMTAAERNGLLSALVSIPSMSRNEKDVADYLENWMSGRGLAVSRVADNLWCESHAPESAPVVLLNAHLDTVHPSAAYSFDPFSPFVDGGRMYGLGTNDDGASLVCLLSAFLALKDAALPYRLVFSATAEEEISGRRGMDLLLESVGHIDAAVIGEPTGMKMAVAERGLMVLDCLSRGVSSHAACAFSENAIYKALDDIAWLRQHDFGRHSELLGPVLATATVIAAGKEHNVIPDTCSFVVDVRSNENYSNGEILSIIRSAFRSEVVPRSTRLASSRIDTDHPLVTAGKALGLESYGSPTLSNSAVCPFPCLKLGPGSSQRSHKADEYIGLDEMDEAEEVYIKLLGTLKF